MLEEIRRGVFKSGDLCGFRETQHVSVVFFLDFGIKSVASDFHWKLPLVLDFAPS